MTRGSSRGRRADPPSADWYDILGYSFGFIAPTPATRTRLAQLYGSYSVPGPCAAASTFVLERSLTDEARTWSVLNDGRLVARAESAGKALSSLERQICLNVIGRQDRMVWIHGATVSGPRAAALIIGLSGAGKTTLAVAVAALGNQAWSDDVTLLDLRSGTTHAMPRCFHLDRRSRRLLRGIGLRRPRGGLGILTPRDIGAGLDRCPDIEVILLLEPGRRGAPPTLEPMDQGEMAGRMFAQHLDHRDHPASDVLAGVRRLVGKTRSYRLSRGGIGETARLVAGFLE